MGAAMHVLFSRFFGTYGYRIRNKGFARASPTANVAPIPAKIQNPDFQNGSDVKEESSSFL